MKKNMSTIKRIPAWKPLLCIGLILLGCGTVSAADNGWDVDLGAGYELAEPNDELANHVYSDAAFEPIWHGVMDALHRGGKNYNQLTGQWEDDPCQLTDAEKQIMIPNVRYIEKDGTETVKNITLGEFFLDFHANLFVGIGVDRYLYFTVEGAESPSDVTEDQMRDMKNLYNLIQIRAKQEGYTDTVPICWEPQGKQVSMIEPNFPFVSAILRFLDECQSICNRLIGICAVYLKNETDYDDFSILPGG